MNQLPSEHIGVCGIIDPDAYTPDTYTTSWVNASDFESLMAIMTVGTLQASATVDAKLEQATDASGTGTKDIANKAITQLTQSGSDGDKQALINFRQEELDVNDGFSFVRLSITVGAAAGDIAGLLLGVSPRGGPATDFDSASVVEVAG